MKMTQSDITVQAAACLKHADAILITASNGLSIAEGYHIFSDNDDFKQYFGDFRENTASTASFRASLRHYPPMNIHVI